MKSVGKNKKFKCGWIALMGPANAGKSTLLNAFMGQKVTIVTPKAQTTRTQIVGIYTDKFTQMIFMDTPGLSQVRGRLGKTMHQAVWQSFRQSDVILVVLDANLYIKHPEFLDRDVSPVADAIVNDDRPLCIAVNKVDMFRDKAKLLPLLTRIHEIWPTAEIFPISALLKDGLEDLRKLICKYLPEGNAQFPEEQISTASIRFMVSEIVREKLFLHLRQEVPYGVAVDVENFEENDENEENKQTIIQAVIYVARPMYKAMVIGKAGSMIKKIGSEARKEIIELIGGKVHLELWVKVKEFWTEDVGFLNDLGLNQGQ